MLQTLFQKQVSILVLFMLALAVLLAPPKAKANDGDVIILQRSGTSTVLAAPVTGGTLQSIPWIANGVLVTRGTNAVAIVPAFTYANGVSVTTGTGLPETNVTAPPGSLFLSTTGTGGIAVEYLKTTGTGNTGWVAK